MGKVIRVKSFRRKGGIRVKGFTRRAPRLSASERVRRAQRARRILLPAAIRATGKRGFYGTLEKLKGKKGIRTPIRLAGWLKGQAKKLGVLSPRHPYVGRRGFRKYPKAARRLSPRAYRRYLRRKRLRRVI